MMGQQDGAALGVDLVHPILDTGFEEGAHRRT